MKFEFNLFFAVNSQEHSRAAIVERLGDAGLTDALLGFGRPGFVGVFVERDGSSLEAALALMAESTFTKTFMPRRSTNVELVVRLASVGRNYLTPLTNGAQIF